MILLDTTILVYAVGEGHPLRTPCRGMLELVRDGLSRATTTVEVVQEFAHIRSRRRSRADAAARAKDYAIGLSPLLRPEEADLFDGLDLLERTTRLGSFDAVLAAAALRRGWSVASADQSFAEVTGLPVLHPGSATFLEDAQAGG